MYVCIYASICLYAYEKICVKECIPLGRYIYIYKQGMALCIVGCSDLPPRPRKHFLSSYFTIIHHISVFHHCIIIIHHHMHHGMHHHFFHQENPSKENHHMHYQIFHHIIIILFHQFFSSLLRAYLMGGKSEEPTMHKAPHRIFIHNFCPSSTQRSLASIMVINLVNRRGTLIGCMLDE